MRNIIAALLATLFLTTNLFPCTTFCLKNKGEVMFGKNYDWNIGDGLIFVNKRNVAKNGTDNDNPAKWVSKYGSVTFNQYGWESPSGGMNEAGLVIELMWLDETQYPKADQRPVLGVLEWIQYNLDSHATVKEVLANADSLRIASAVKLHYLVNDKAGNTATIEFLDGRLVAHTGENLPVPTLTNDSYARSISFAKHADPTRAKSVSSLDRFVRASEKTKAYAARPRNEKESVDYAFEILANAAQPGATQWSIVYDQKRSRIHFRTMQNPAIRTIDTLAFDFGCGSPVTILDINSNHSGDVTAKFIPYSRDANRDLIERAFSGTEFLKNVPGGARDSLAAYPEGFACGSK
jgi:choloylglycine hydrolase